MIIKKHKKTDEGIANEIVSNLQEQQQPEEEPEIVNVPEPEPDESDFEDLNTNDEDEIEEYIPQGGSVNRKDIRDDNDD